MNRSGMMSGIWKAAVVLVALAAIGCGVAAQESPSPPEVGNMPSVQSQEDLLQRTENETSKLDIASEREEILAFTRGALQIEAERNSLMAYFAQPRFGRLGALHVQNRYFLKGMSEEQQAVLAGYRPFEGMLSLRTRLLLLDVPQALEPVKDGLAETYRSEIGLAREQAVMEKVTRLYPGVTKDNIEALIQNAEQFKGDYTRYVFEKSKTRGYWGQVQLFRQQIYNRWAEILQEQGIDAAKEGFPELVVGK